MPTDPPDSASPVSDSASPVSDSASPVSDAASSVIDAAHAAIARASAREVAVHQAYDRARNVLRARERRRALVPLAREMFSSPDRLDAHAGRSTPSLAWGLPVARRGHLLAVISPTASAITDQVRITLAGVVVVVASLEEQERIRRVTDPRQRLVLLSVRVPEPAHEDIVDLARRSPVPPSEWVPG